MVEGHLSQQEAGPGAADAPRLASSSNKKRSKPLKAKKKGPKN